MLELNKWTAIFAPHVVLSADSPGMSRLEASAKNIDSFILYFPFGERPETARTKRRNPRHMPNLQSLANEQAPMTKKDVQEVEKSTSPEAENQLPHSRGKLKGRTWAHINQDENEESAPALSGPSNPAVDEGLDYTASPRSDNADEIHEFTPDSLHYKWVESDKNDIEFDTKHITNRHKYFDLSLEAFQRILVSGQFHKESVKNGSLSFVFNEV